MPCLAWADGIGAALGSLFSYNSNAAILFGKVAAVVAAYVLNVSMQPLHINLRASLMEYCPLHQQAIASLWITCFSAFGSVFGTSIAYFASPSFKLLAASSCCVLGVALILHGVETRRQMAVLTLLKRQEVTRESIASVIRRFGCLFRLALRLPNVTRRVCRTQMFAWFGWFSMLYYMNR